EAVVPIASLIPQFSRKRNNPVQRLPDGVRRRRVRQPYPAVVPERRTRHERDAGLRDETRAEIRARDLSERVNSKEEVEGAERVHEFDAGKVLPEAGDHDVAAFAKLA